jgi:hypothetical protein
MDLFRYGVRFGTQGQTLDHQHLTPLRISVLIARNLTGFSTFDHLLLLLLLFNLLVFNSAKGTFSASCSLPTGKPDRDYSNPALRFFFLSFFDATPNPPQPSNLSGSTFYISSGGLNTTSFKTSMAKSPWLCSSSTNSPRPKRALTFSLAF